MGDGDRGGGERGIAARKGSANISIFYFFLN